MYEAVSQAALANAARIATYNSGYLRCYTGTRPANVAAGVSGTLLGSLTFAATAFTNSGRTATAGTITGDSAADDTGTIGYVACFASDGTTLLSLHTVGLAASGMECIFNTLDVAADQPIDFVSLTITQPDGA